MKDEFFKIFGLFITLAIIILFIFFIMNLLPENSIAQIFMILPFGVALTVFLSMIGGILIFFLIYMFPIFGIFLLISTSVFLPIFFIFL